MVGEVDLLGEEETFFHRNAKVSDPLNLFAVVAVTNRHLWHPDRVDKALFVLDQVVEKKV